MGRGCIDTGWRTVEVVPLLDACAQVDGDAPVGERAIHAQLASRSSSREVAQPKAVGTPPLLAYKWPLVVHIPWRLASCVRDRRWPEGGGQRRVEQPFEVPCELVK